MRGSRRLSRNTLKPFDASGVARIIEEGARLADDREKCPFSLAAFPIWFMRLITVKPGRP